MTCPKCGTENAPGDAFCGSCGAFLEFAAEEAAEEVPAGSQVPAPAAPAPAAPVPVAAPAAAAAPPAAPAPAAPVPAAAPPAGSASGVTCGVCGHANPAGRRFCISCGGRLGPPAAAGAAASGADPGKPAWDFPMPPRPAAPPAAATGAPPATSATGRSRLLLGGGIVVAVVAVVALGAAFLLGGGLGGGTVGTSPHPSSEASSEAPSPAETAAAGTPGEEPSQEPSTEPTVPPATIPPGPAVGIKITGAKASSQLKADRAPKYMFDGSPATTWSSAAGKFQGAWVEVSFAPAAITRIQIWGGWQKSDPLYLGSHRPQNVTVAFDGGDPVPLELLDVRKPQGVDIPPELGIVRATRVRITIADVYPAQKTAAKGTPTKDVAISEIRLFGIPVAP